MPEGTRAGGAMPGPELEVHGAAAIVAGAADASKGTRRATSRAAAAKCPAARKPELSRAGFRLLWIDPEIGDGLRNEVRTVLLAKLQRV